MAFDCVSPQKSRMKIYARCPDIRLASVMRIISIFVDNSKITNGLEELRMLWNLVFTCVDQGQAGHVPYKAHITSGILYHFEVRPSSFKVTAKVYLPVKHYAKDDLFIAKGLQTFFNKRRGSQDQSARDFMGVLDKMCTYRCLEATTGLQAYISCKIENDSLEITSYLSPEIYNDRRWSHGKPTI
ncbi:putative dimethylallyl tryptophan synthase protein [Botrytis fragariae]|uniref:Putative dimethylallyl tryptophan synthase protein n=1 Tax=Botrytis fragariae TaxID=1964551 RepID=A0A8H6APW6_9HELO|nr:putative dimethylallyl tryptophan synthase protein [Botrytis fragariae]KAF5871401.1 putative dimethylallyl tryptophan synthase protein [Botrytis fragariae]